MPRYGSGVLVEEIHWPLYDTIEIPGPMAPPIQNALVFQAPQGQPSNVLAVPKTPWHTNMTQAGVLPSPERFRILAFRAWMPFQYNYKDTLTDYFNIFNQCYLKLTIQNKEYLTCQLIFLPGGLGVQAASIGPANEPATALSIGQNGIADPRAIFVLAKPIQLETQESFKVEITWLGPFTCTRTQFLTFCMDGVLERPVQ